MELSFEKLAFVYVVTGLVLIISFKKPTVGLLFFLCLIFIRPQDDRPNFAELHLPYLMVAALTVLYFMRAAVTHRMVPQSRLVLPFILLISWITVSAIFGAAPAESFEKLQDLIVITATFMCILAFVDKDADLELVFATIVVCGLVFSYYTLFLGSDCIETQDGTSCGRRNFVKINRNFGQPNYLGLTIVFMFHLAYSFWLTYKNILVRAVVLAIMLLFVWVLMLTGSRAAFVSFAASLVFYWLTGARKVGGLVALGLVAAAIAIASPEVFITRMSTLGDVGDDTSFMSRVELWRVGLDLVAQHPLTGVGLGNFRMFAPNTEHNVFIQLASEMGLPAVFLWFWLMSRAFRGLWQARRNYEMSSRAFGRNAAHVLMAAMIGILVQSFSTGFAHREILYILDRKSVV